MTEKVGKIEMVIKGGQPWGFTLYGGTENRSAVIIHKIEQGGKAERQGSLKVGDHVIKINDVHCLSLSDALQLIDSAFRTLTILVWRPIQCFEELHSQDIELCAQHASVSPYSSLNSLPLCTNVPENESNAVSSNLSDATSFSANTMKINSNALTIYSNLLYSDSFVTESTDTKSEKQFSFDKSKYINTSNKLNFGIHHGNVNVKKDFKSLPVKTRGAYNFHCINAGSQLLGSTKLPKSILKTESQMLHDKVQAESLHKQDEKCSIPKYNRSCEMKCTLMKQMTIGQISECVCCMYPKCHSKYLDCKIHSPPEKDVVMPQGGIDQNFSNSHYFYSDCEFENQKYNSLTVLDMLPQNINALNLNNSSCKENNVNENNGFKLHDALNITNPLNVKFVTNAAQDSCESIVKTTNDMNYIKKSKNSLGYNITDSITSPALQLKSKNTAENNSLHLFQHSKEIIQNLFFQQNSYQFRQNEMHNFDGVYQKKSTFLTDNHLRCDDSASIKNSTEGSFPDFQEHALDEELCLIEENAPKQLELVSCASQSPDIPLPPPPVNILNEIVLADDSLPSPPASPSETSKFLKIGAKPEVIYENLEMLNTKCSVVNSATQTMEPDNNAEESQKIHSDKLIDSVFVSKLMNSWKKNTSTIRFQSHCSFADASIKHSADKFAIDRHNLDLPLTSAYFTTSEPKAKLLTRYISNLHQDNTRTGRELVSKKEELMASITKKLDILRLEHVALKEEMRQNDELGNTLSTKVQLLAKPNETEKFSLHVEELEKITNLMLSLSGRLARAENALLILPSDISSSEKNVLEMKYSTLKQQYEEAMYLKKNIDRRNCHISLFLQKYFTEDEFTDYDHFIKMKAKLLMDDRELDEKIKLGEEQLEALKSSIKAQKLHALKNGSNLLNKT